MKKIALVLLLLLLFGSTHCFAADTVAGTTITYTYTVLGSTYTGDSRITNIVLQNSLGDAIAVINDVIAEERIIKINDLWDSGVTVSSADIAGYTYLPNYAIMQWGTLDNCNSTAKFVILPKSITETFSLLYGNYDDSIIANYNIEQVSDAIISITCNIAEEKPLYWLAISK